MSGEDGGTRRRRSAALKLLLALILAGAIAFAVLFGMVMSGAKDEINGEPAAMVVLGCEVKPWGPSILLQDRLDKALEYWRDHPNLVIVVSGAQGPDEPSTEAAAMAEYLTGQGVPAEQILLEEESHNTWENLRRSRAVLEEHGYDVADGVVVVSNAFHLTRVRMLAERLGYGEISTLGAPSSHLPSRLKMYIREPIALVKSFVLDR